MMELVKNKLTIGFLILVFGMSYIDSMNMKKYEDAQIVEEKELVVMYENY